jgi:hypothetical protein
VITKLVIGSSRHDVTETSCPVDRGHPHTIRAWVETIHSSKTQWTVCSFSPTVIAAVIYAWDKDPLLFDWIILRSDTGKDTPLLDARNREWLAHFAIEDLYMRGEFDEFLR